jgi:cobalamin biosynthetic protein CobC
MLTRNGLSPTGGTALFQSRLTDRARWIDEYLAHRRILIRVFDDPPRLRVGLPGPEDDWRRLAGALSGLPESAPDAMS